MSDKNNSNTNSEDVVFSAVLGWLTALSVSIASLADFAF
jgi:hypothetical protein